MCRLATRSWRSAAGGLPGSDENGAIVGIQDMARPAHLLTCEMGRARRGLDVELDLVPAARNRHERLRIMLFGKPGAHAVVAERGREDEYCASSRSGS